MMENLGLQHMKKRRCTQMESWRSEGELALIAKVFHLSLTHPPSSTNPGKSDRRSQDVCARSESTPWGRKCDRLLLHIPMGKTIHGHGMNLLVIISRGMQKKVALVALLFRYITEQHDKRTNFNW